MEKRDPLTEKIIGCAHKVHSELGPGFSEKIYHNALKIALTSAGLNYNTEKQYKIKYANQKVGSLRLDLIIENSIIVEVKALTGYMPKYLKRRFYLT